MRTRRTLTRLAVLLMSAAFSGCLIHATATEKLRQQYAQEPVVVPSSEWLRSKLEDLPASDGRCFSFSKPCLLCSDRQTCELHAPGASLCLQWGSDTECFQLEPAAADGSVSLRSLTQPGPGRLGLWLAERVDASFRDKAQRTTDEAEADVLAAERIPVDRPDTLWAHARMVFHVPNLSALSAQVQGGYRRWLNTWLLVAVGGGFEAALFPRFSLAPQAALATARLEFSSSTKLKSGFLNLPWLSAYFGLTGLFVTSSGGGTGLRGFVGVSSLIPVNVELGLTVLQIPGRSPQPSFFVAGGVGW
jgi:hypothetical protein